MKAYKLLQQQHDADAREAIIWKLYEGVDQCTAGFHARVNEVLYDCVNRTAISDFLSRFRDELVRQTALDKIDKKRVPEAYEVHFYNYFYTVANQNNYGVRPKLEDDPYRVERYISEEEVKTALTQTFKAHYTPIQIISTLINDIKTKFNQITEEEKDLMSENVPIEFKVYDRCLKFLANMVSPDQPLDLDYDDYLQEDEEDNVIAFNWKNIAELLFTTLCQEGYFINVPQQPLTQLIRDGSLLNQDTAYLILPMIQNSDDFIRLLDFCSQESKEALLQLYFDNISFSSQLELLYKLQPILNENEKLKEICLNIMRLVFSYHSENFMRALQNGPTFLAALYTKNRVRVDSFLHYFGCYFWLKENDDLVNNQDDLQVDNFILACFSQITDQGNNALMFAVKNNSSLVKPILALIAKLPKETQEAILKEKDSDDLNALMLAIALNSHSSIRAVCECIGQLDEAMQLSILTQKRNGTPALIFAILCGEGAEVPLLECIAKLDKNVQVSILTECSSIVGHEAQIYAVLQNIDAVKPLCECIGKLEINRQKSIVTHRFGNALIDAIASRPDKTVPLLESLGKLEGDVQTAVFTQLKPYGMDVVTLVSRNNPGVLKLLLQHIKTLSSNNIKSIFKVIKAHGNEEVYAAFNLVYLLDDFKQKADYHRQSGHIKAADAVMTIHGKLDAEFERYLNKDVNQAQLSQTWKKILSKEDNQGVENEDIKEIHKHRGLKDIAAKLLVGVLALVTVIPALYFLMMHRNSFFKPMTNTDSANKLDKLSTAVDEVNLIEPIRV